MTRVNVLLLLLLCGNGHVIAGSTLLMEKTGYCGEQKKAKYVGKGRSISFSIDEIEGPIVITSNTERPKYLGGYEITLVDKMPTSDWPFILNYNITIEYNVSLETSGQRLKINATSEDQVSGQTTIQSCNCLFPVRIHHQSTSESHVMLTVVWEHPKCCGWEGELEYTVVLVGTDCEAEPLFTSSTNATCSVAKSGRYEVLVIVKNTCGEVTTANATHTIGADAASSSVVIAQSTEYALLIIALGALLLCTCFT